MKKKQTNLTHLLRASLKTLLIGSILTFIGLVIYSKLVLPDVSILNDYQLQVPLKIYSADAELIAEYGEKKREPVALNEIPEHMIKAIVATEDARFYNHAGVDPIGLTRAILQLVASGEKSQGGSTITMQVARNFFLTRKKTYTRKINEILLAFKIDAELSKDKILELYLNKIYFGHRAYGIAAAAKVYYGKKLGELTLEQMAMLAGLPKAPSTLNPVTNPEGALQRRNHVLERMYELEFIDEAAYQQAIRSEITADLHHASIGLNAPYVAEMVRSELYNQYGPDIYTSGFNVFTTISKKRQLAAEQALHQGLVRYDRRHGYRGPVEKIDLTKINKLEDQLAELEKITQRRELKPGLIVTVENKRFFALLKQGDTVEISWNNMQWARKALPEGWIGPELKSAYEIVSPGDIVYLTQDKTDHWHLAQEPEIEGSLIAMNPTDGALEAVVGGYDFNRSHFNRAIQAQRQPGSCIKPFIYAAALAEGYSLASIINDSPVVVSNYDGEDLWRPQNHNKRFYGPTRLREGLIQSRNLVSIRLLENLNIDDTIAYLTNFGFDEKNLPRTLSLALGTNTVTPLNLNTSYASLANGGKRVSPYIIAKITDDDSNTIYSASPAIACDDCEAENPNKPIQIAPQIIAPQIAYLINSVLQDVIQHGTGRAAKVLARNDLAGKTGSTNDLLDAWFAGYNPDLVATVWIGYDKPRSIREYGAGAALPVWIDFMRTALHGRPMHQLQQPPGLVSMRIDPATGLAAKPGQTDAIFETFIQEQAPKQAAGNSYSGYSNNNSQHESLF